MLVRLFRSSRVAGRSYPTSEAWADFDSPAAAFPASAAAAGRVFAPTAGSVVGAFAPSADFSLHWSAVEPSADDPAPDSAGVSGAPVAASRTAFPAVVGISGRVSRFPCLEEQVGDGVQDPLRAPGQGGGEHCFLVAELMNCQGAVQQHDWLLDGTALLLLWRVRLRGREMPPAGE